MRTSDDASVFFFNAECKNTSEPVLLLCGSYYHSSSDLPCQCPTSYQPHQLSITENNHFINRSSSSDNQLMCVNHSPENLNASVRLLIPQEEDTKELNSQNAIQILSRFYEQDNIIDIIRLLIAEKVIEVNATNRNNYNALHLICFYYKGQH